MVKPNISILIQTEITSNKEAIFEHLLMVLRQQFPFSDIERKVAAGFIKSLYRLLYRKNMLFKDDYGKDKSRKECMAIIGTWMFQEEYAKLITTHFKITNEVLDEIKKRFVDFKLFSVDKNGDYLIHDCLIFNYNEHITKEVIYTFKFLNVTPLKEENDRGDEE